LPVAARAQQGERMRRIGWMLALTGDHPEAQARMTAFRDGLAALGWIEGRNLQIDYRWELAIPTACGPTRPN
jgi:hypothetical protein